MLLDLFFSLLLVPANKLLSHACVCPCIYNVGGREDFVEVCTMLWIPKPAKCCPKNQNRKMRLPFSGDHGLPFR